MYYMNVYVLLFLCVFRYKSLRRTDPSSVGVLPSVCVIECGQVQD